MKNFYALLLSLLLCVGAFAQSHSVIVKGTVKFANGAPAPNRIVYINTDSNSASISCYQIHQKVTNANGYYIDTITCTGIINQIRVRTADCNGLMLVKEFPAPPAVIESNFTLTCNPQNTACNAQFSAERLASNYRSVKFNSNNSITASGDNIVGRTWRFGDGDTLGGNSIDPQHTYLQDGVYNVCLRIRTASGCISEYCKLVEVRGPHCVSKFVALPQPLTSATGFAVKFNSNMSVVVPPDSIRERIWTFGDGTSLSGNTVEPLHVYSTAGTYNACLVIRSTSGCSDTSCITLQLPVANQIICASRFTYVPNAGNVQFNSTSAFSIVGDSIISRTWRFGDSSLLTGNVVNPVHAYTRPGMYNVCLTIKTARGCESTECKLVTTTQASTNCIAQFTSQRTAPRKVSFNSSMSWVPANDTIVERKWEFGDGTALLSGNVISPIKEYANFGIYTVCLKIKTARGCENRVCMLVRVQDSTIAGTTNEPIRIVNMYPNPVTTQLNTVVWSLHNNVAAELAIYDIYGVKKFGISKILLQGNNYTVLPTGGLLTGPYFFRVTTMYGIRSRQFYKL